MPYSPPSPSTAGVTGVVDVTPVAPSATDYLTVRLTDGSNFYSAGSATPVGYSVQSPYIATGAAGAAVRPIALLNPIGSGTVIRIWEIWSMLGNATPAAAAGHFEVSAFRISAFTGGTALTAGKMDTADSDSILNSVTRLAHTITTNTASTGTAAWISHWGIAWGTTVHSGFRAGEYVRLGESTKPLVIRPGEGLGTSVLTRVAGQNILMGIEWSEAAT